MNVSQRLSFVAALVTFGAASAASAQIPGMPLFTNPRYGTGIRIHADAGTDLGGTQLSFSSAQVYQAGVTFALGPVGLAANVGSSKNDLQGIQACSAGSNTCNPETKVTASALAQFRLIGGGGQNGALSVFGGLSTDFSGYDSPQFLANCSGATPAGFIPQAICDSLTAKVMTIPLGVSAGFKLGPLVVWGAPRLVLYRAKDCGATALALCNNRENEFRYAVGADLPILGLLSLRAAYDGGKFQGVNVNRLGVGASIGVGGVH
jgi:hypothetical protein